MARHPNRRAAFAAAIVLLGILGGTAPGAGAVPAPVPGVEAQAAGNVVWVTQGGNDASPGTQAAPVRTLPRALALAGPGDTIMVGGGTWPRLMIDSKSGAPGRPILIRSAPNAENQVWFANGSLSSEFGVYVRNSSHLILDDLNATNALWGTRIESSTYITYRNSEITNIGQEALAVTTQSANVLLEGNTIHHTGKIVPQWGEGIYLGTGSTDGDRVHDVTIRNNEIHHTNAEAIDIKPSVVNVVVEGNLVHDIATANSGAVVLGIGRVNYPDANTVIRGNRIWNISTTSQWSDGNGISLSQGTATVYDNVIWNVQHRGILADGNFVSASKTVRIYNNTIAGFGEAAVEAWTSPDPSTASIYGNTITTVDRLPASPTYPGTPTNSGSRGTAGPSGGIAEIPDGFVAKTFEDFLGRAPSAEEQVFWDAQLRAGMQMRDFVWFLANSEPWLGETVERLYVDTLGRASDRSGRLFWVTLLRSQLGVADVAARFYGSDEYFVRIAGSDQRRWLVDVYEKIFGREPDPQGLAFWSDRVSSKGRVQVALELYQSAESRGVRVDRLYERLFGRPADAGGRDYWATKMLAGGDVRLAVELTQTSEYLGG